MDLVSITSIMVIDMKGSIAMVSLVDLESIGGLLEHIMRENSATERRMARADGRSVTSTLK